MDKCICYLGYILSPLGGSGSEVANWKVKQTGTPVMVLPMGMCTGGAVEDGDLMMCGGKGGVAPLGNSWYVVVVVLTCG